MNCLQIFAYQKLYTNIALHIFVFFFQQSGIVRSTDKIDTRSVVIFCVIFRSPKENERMKEESERKGKPGNSERVESS